MELHAVLSRMAVRLAQLVIDRFHVNLDTKLLEQFMKVMHSSPMYGNGDPKAMENYMSIAGKVDEIVSVAPGVAAPPRRRGTIVGNNGGYQSESRARDEMDSLKEGLRGMHLMNRQDRDRSPVRQERGQSPVRSEYSPERRGQSPVRRDQSLVTRNQSPVRRSRNESPVRRDYSEFSPVHRNESPVRRQHNESPARQYSPVRREHSPVRRDYSPVRREHSPVRREMRDHSPRYVSEHSSRASHRATTSGSPMHSSSSGRRSTLQFSGSSTGRSGRRYDD